MSTEPTDVMARLTSKMEKLTGTGPVKAETPAEPGSPPSEPDVPDDQPGDGEPQTPEMVDVEWEGQRYSVPPSLKNAFLRNEDYTKKTQALGEQQRAMDHAREVMMRSQAENNFRQSIDQEVRELAVIDAYLTEAQKLNWGQMSMEQMFRARAEMDQVKDRRSALEKVIGEKKDKFSQEMDGKLKELRQRSRELAATSIPGFNEQTEGEIRKYANSRGLSDMEIDNVLLDPRSAKVLWEAMQYTKVQANLGKAQSATRALRPGAGEGERMPQAVVDKLNLRKALAKAPNSVQKARLIEDSLMRKFEKR